LTSHSVRAVMLHAGRRHHIKRAYIQTGPNGDIHYGHTQDSHSYKAVITARTCHKIIIFLNKIQKIHYYITSFS